MKQAVVIVGLLWLMLGELTFYVQFYYSVEFANILMRNQIDLERLGSKTLLTLVTLKCYTIYYYLYEVNILPR